MISRRGLFRGLAALGLGSVASKMATMLPASVVGHRSVEAVVRGGKIISISVVNAGSGYTSPPVFIHRAMGSGAIIEAVIDGGPTA